MKTKSYKKMPRPNSGMTLFEVLASSLVVLVIASVAMPFITTPTKRVERFRQDLLMQGYLNNQFLKIEADVKEGLPLPTGTVKYCSDQQTCQPELCGAVACELNWQTDCQNGQPPAIIDGDSVNLGLNQLITDHPSMCYAFVVMNHDCDPTLGNNHYKQVCAKVKAWGGDAYHEVYLSSAFFKP